MASMQTKLPALAQDVIKTLQLEPHPERGFFRETYRSSNSTVIYYLITNNDGDTVWHRVLGRDEFWHFYAGDHVQLTTATPEGNLHKKRVCGSNVLQGEEPQVLVPGDYWQSVRCLGEWALFGCTVCPPFDFGSFEMASKDFERKLKECAE